MKAFIRHWFNWAGGWLGTRCGPATGSVIDYVVGSVIVLLSG